MAPEWTTESPLYPGLPDLDPYAEWTLGPGRQFFFAASGPPPWLPVLLQLEGVTPREFAEGKDFVDDPDKWRSMVSVPQLARDRNELRFCPALVKETFFNELATNTKLRKLVLDVQVSEPLHPASVPPPGQSGP